MTVLAHRYDCGVYACCVADAVCAWFSEGKTCDEQEPKLAGWLPYEVIALIRSASDQP